MIGIPKIGSDREVTAPLYTGRYEFMKLCDLDRLLIDVLVNEFCSILDQVSFYAPSGPTSFINHVATLSLLAITRSVGTLDENESDRQLIRR
ncbi:MAG: hypothetical protein REV35_02985 [Burkholderia sp.]|nr:hypothetical protein [Burkholderia sp.]